MVFGSLNGMKVTIDAAGRIVVPKPLRDQLRLREGSALEIEIIGSSLVVQPVTQSAAIVLQDGLLVYVGDVPNRLPVQNLVEGLREERLDEFAGR
jgi:AbrB family looped-hinge helix DNA binding protein